MNFSCVCNCRSPDVCGFAVLGNIVWVFAGLLFFAGFFALLQFLLLHFVFGLKLVQVCSFWDPYNSIPERHQLPYR